MKLQNGFELEGNINYVIVTISNKPTQVLIIESVLEIEQLRELFKDNNIIVDTTETIENIYNVGGLIDIKTQDGKNYVWLYFVNSSSRELVKTVIEDVEKLKQEKTELQVAMAELMETVMTMQGTV
jgi:hypothetical protein